MPAVEAKKKLNQRRQITKKGCYRILVALGLWCVLLCCFAWVIAKEAIVDLLDDAFTSLQETKRHLANHPYLNGNFAPVYKQYTAQPVEVVRGAIPSDLEGLFVRTGPNPLPGWTKRYHWFDGHGMLHNLRFVGGNVTYTNKFIGTPRYRIERKKGKDYFLRIGEISGFVGILKIIFCETFKRTYWKLTDLTAGPANTHTVMYNRRFYLLHEASLPFEAKLKPDGSFESIGYATFGGVLNYAVSAHPKVDYQSNSMLFHSYSGESKVRDTQGAMKYGELLSNGTVRMYHGLEMNYTCFAHDMFMTPKFLILIDSSVHFNIGRVLEGKSIFAFNPRANLRFALISRESGQLLQWFDTGKPHAIVHGLNAWEEPDGTIVLWAPVGDDMELELDSHGNFFFMTEVRLHPTTGQVTMERLDKQYNQEFCNVRTDYYGRFSEYGVAGILVSAKQDGLFSGFIIWDVAAKKIFKKVDYPLNEYGGEPVVIEKGSDNSRDFYVGTFTYSEALNESFFVLYDEKGELVAKLKIPYRVPYGFHGNWISERLLQGHFTLHTPKEKEMEVPAFMTL